MAVRSAVAPGQTPANGPPEMLVGSAVGLSNIWPIHLISLVCKSTSDVNGIVLVMYAGNILNFCRLHQSSLPLSYLLTN